MAPIHRTKKRVITKIITEPVNTPIWLERNSPTRGTTKTAQTMPCRISAAIRMIQTVRALPIKFRLPLASCPLAA